MVAGAFEMAANGSRVVRKYFGTEEKLHKYVIAVSFPQVGISISSLQGA